MSEVLTKKQEAFATAFVETGNASQAYRLAYDASHSTSKSVEQNASKLLRHVKIAPRITALNAAIQERSNLDMDYVVDSFREIYERSMQHEAVLDSKGKHTGEYQFNPAGANKAMENIGRLLGFYVDKSLHVTATPKELAEAQVYSEELEGLTLDQMIAKQVIQDELARRALTMSEPELKQQLALTEGRTATEGE